LETVLDGYECRDRPFKSNELQQHVAQTWCGVGLRIFLHELYPSPLTAEKGFASKTSNRKKIKSKNNPFATHASSHFL
jgi:chloramphenicol 3-O-phosphotransferase